MVGYLQEKLFSAALPAPVLLFQTAQNSFTNNGAKGHLLTAHLVKNWPQIKMAQMRVVEIDTGLRQVDIYAGLNALLLLFVLHRHGQAQVKADESSLFALSSLRLFRLRGNRSRQAVAHDRI